MKKLLIILLLFVTLTITAKEYSAPNKNNTAYTDTTTNDSYRIKNVVYPVFKSKSNARYIWKKSSKTNKLYKY